MIDQEQRDAFVVPHDEDSKACLGGACLLVPPLLELVVERFTCCLISKVLRVFFGCFFAETLKRKPFSHLLVNLSNVDRLNIRGCTDTTLHSLTNNKRSIFSNVSTKTKSALFSELSGFFQLNVPGGQLHPPICFFLPQNRKDC